MFGFRVASILMMVVLSIPLVRECCVPVAVPLPCHHEQPINPNDPACAAAQTAVAETKVSHGAVLRIESPALISDSSVLKTALSLFTSEEVAHPTIPATCIYLRTGALLI
jgi:hypothetical protein